MKRRILIIAEAVTLAHVARPLALAKILEGLDHEVTIACSPSARRWIEGEGRSFMPIDSISQQQFLRALHMGRPVFDAPTLKGYVEADLALMDQVRPHLVIGDFRLSLWVSSKLAKIPYGNVTNAYWSPRYFQYAQVPDIPLTRTLGVGLADVIFHAVYRPAFAWHARAYSETARHFGVPKPTGGLLGAYTESDCSAYPDLVEFYDTVPQPSQREIFLGPLEWSPAASLPDDCQTMGSSRPLVYATMGSSGSPHLIQLLCDALAELDVDLLIATAGATPSGRRRNARLVDFAPGKDVCARSSVVIGNGGSPITYQALAAGVPILGLPGNLDQFMNMSRVEAAHVGLVLRGATTTRQEILNAAGRLLREGRYKHCAKEIQRSILRSSARERVAQWLAGLTG